MISNSSQLRRESVLPAESDKRRELLHSLLGQLRTEEQRLLSDMRDAETTFKKLRGLETTESRGSLGALHALEWAVELDADACPRPHRAQGFQAMQGPQLAAQMGVQGAQLVMAGPPPPLGAPTQRLLREERLS